MLRAEGKGALPDLGLFRPLRDRFPFAIDREPMLSFTLRGVLPLRAVSVSFTAGRVSGRAPVRMTVLVV